MITDSKWKRLRKQYPWPVSQIHGARKWHGWLRDENKESLLNILNEFEAPLVIEIGTWLGMSAKFFLKHSKCKLITIDNFKGSKEHHENVEHKTILDAGLEQQARINLLNFRGRCLIAKGNSSQIMPELFREQLAPDIIYIDGCHEFNGAYSDISQAVSFFPDAIVCGDDGNLRDVQKAISKVLEERDDLRVEMTGGFWRIHS